MESREDKKADDAPECLENTEQSFPGEETGIAATWLVGG